MNDQQTQSAQREARSDPPSGSPRLYCGECGGEHEPSGARLDCIRHWKRRAVNAENEANVLKSYGNSYWKRLAVGRGEDIAAIEAALAAYGKFPDDCWIGTNATADRVTWLVRRCTGGDATISKLHAEISSVMETVKAQRRRIHQLGDQLTEYQTMLFCLCVAKGNEEGLRIDLRNNNASRGSVLRFRRDAQNPNVTVVTVEANAKLRDAGESGVEST